MKILIEKVDNGYLVELDMTIRQPMDVNGFPALLTLKPTEIIDRKKVFGDPGVLIRFLEEYHNDFEKKENENKKR